MRKLRTAEDGLLPRAAHLERVAAGVRTQPAWLQSPDSSALLSVASTLLSCSSSIFLMLIMILKKRLCPRFRSIRAFLLSSPDGFQKLQRTSRGTSFLPLAAKASGLSTWEEQGQLSLLDNFTVSVLLRDHRWAVTGQVHKSRPAVTA